MKRQKLPAFGSPLIYKLFAFTLFALAFGLRAEGQQSKPEWNISFSKTTVNQCETVELVYTCAIPETWYIYSNNMDPDLGPILPTFEVLEIKGLEFVDKQPQPRGFKIKYDDVWEGNVSIFVKKLEFRQKVKITDLNPSLKLAIEYQMCSEVSGQCILFDFERTITGLKVTKSAKPCASDKAAVKAPNGGTETTEVPQTAEPVAGSAGPCDSIIQSLQGRINTIPTNAAGVDVPDDIAAQPNLLNKEGCEPLVYVDDEGKSNQEEEGSSLFLFALAAFIGGLAGLLTPCVFPMIPMTVTFFLKNAKDKKRGMFQGLFYGFSIIAIYTLIGTIFTVIFGATGANEFATNAGVNIAFFIIFVIFAISFFGAFEITLPSSFVNKIDKQSDKGGLVGVFFMAFTLVLVSFSCTGPIVGTILVEASQGGVVRPVIGMIGFSLAFALPFSLFAIFPQWLNTLPKSGGWLNSVKVVLGFVELALGLKFLSVADQVQHWGLLDREVYIGLWIVLSILCGLYLLGKIKFSHDSDMKYLGVPRLFFAIASFAFVFYLIPGLFGAALPALAGYLPPTTSHGFNLPAMINGDRKGNLCEEPKYTDFLHLPHGIKGYFEYSQAIACARTLQKPLFIDFTGHGCVNCRKMEDRVWANPEILKMLQEDFVVVALYVDDRTEADSSEWFVSQHDGKMKKTIGKINADLQICKFKHNAQPYYVLLDNDEQLLAQPIGSEYDVVKFRKFLEGAKKSFEKKLEAQKKQ